MNEKTINKFFEQLRVIISLRNFGGILETMLSNLSIYCDQTIYHFYRKGIGIGIEKGIKKSIDHGIEFKRKKEKQEFVKKNLEAQQEGYSIDLIADVFKISKEKIQEIIKSGLKYKLYNANYELKIISVQMI